MTETPPYSLSNVYLIVRSRRRLIIFITLVAMAAGVLFYLIKPRKYEAKTVFVLKNPLYADRNFLYNNETKFIDYFASEDDIDKFMLMAESDSVQQKIISASRLTPDKSDEKLSDSLKMLKLRAKLFKNLNIMRTDKKSLTLSYTDKDRKVAAKVANTAVAVLEQSLRAFYNDIRHSMYQSIMNKVHEEDSAIQVLTDTLIAMRDKYGIYDMISPSRYNIMLSGVKANGNANYAQGLEEIQNFESVKDQLVSDKARHISLINQYTTGTEINELPLTKVLKAATPPTRAKGIGLLTVIIASAFTGFMFSLLYILFMDFSRRARA